MLRATACVSALAILLGCEGDQTVAIRVCSQAIIPPEGASLVVVDGSFIDEQELLPTPEAGPPVQTTGPDAGQAGDVVGPDERVEMSAVRVSTRDEQFEPLKEGVRELSSGTDMKQRGFDLVVELPVQERAEWIHVDGLLDSVLVSSFTRRIHDRDDLEAVDMPLSARCYGEKCAFGQSCLGGSCEIAADTTQGPHCTKAALE